MEDSVLDSIKKLLGIPNDYNEFDQDVVMQINSAFFALNQIGARFPYGIYTIADSTSKWDDLFDYDVDLSGIKVLVYLKVRLAFDPPTSSALIEAIKAQISELEWRICVENDLKEINYE